jgi:hypothetical protein
VLRANPLRCGLWYSYRYRDNAVSRNQRLNRASGVSLGLFRPPSGQNPITVINILLLPRDSERGRCPLSLIGNTAP